MGDEQDPLDVSQTIQKRIGERVFFPEQRGVQQGNPGADFRGRVSDVGKGKRGFSRGAALPWRFQPRVEQPPAHGDKSRDSRRFREPDERSSPFFWKRGWARPPCRIQKPGSQRRFHGRYRPELNLHAAGGLKMRARFAEGDMLGHRLGGGPVFVPGLGNLLLKHVAGGGGGEPVWMRGSGSWRSRDSGGAGWGFPELCQRLPGSEERDFHVGNADLERCSDGFNRQIVLDSQPERGGLRFREPGKNLTPNRSCLLGVLADSGRGFPRGTRRDSLQRAL